MYVHIHLDQSHIHVHVWVACMPTLVVGIDCVAIAHWSIILKERYMHYSHDALDMFVTCMIVEQEWSFPPPSPSFVTSTAYPSQTTRCTYSIRRERTTTIMWFLVYRIIDYVISPNHLHIVNVLGTVSIEVMYHVWVACTYSFEPVTCTCTCTRVGGM